MPAVIRGANFFGTPTARLDNNIPIAITNASTDTLTGTVPAGATPGVYTLIVVNPDSQAGTLSPGYTVLNPLDPNTTLEASYLSLFGTGASGSAGDDDHAQVIFFEVPADYSGSLYFRLFDADTGGGGIITDTVDKPQGLYDTTTRYTLRGDGGYSSDARSAHPSPAGITSGALLAETVIGADPAYHSNWALVFGPYSASEGQCINGSCIFKLVAEAVSGNDGNYYNATLSSMANDNQAPAGSRIFAYSWTFPLASGSTQWLYPYVPSGASTFEQHNWDLDRPAGSISLQTPMRALTIPDGSLSGDGVEASSSHAVQIGEDGSTWTTVLETTAPWNDLTYWVTVDGADTAIFARPAINPPPQ